MFAGSGLTSPGEAAAAAATDVVDDEAKGFVVGGLGGSVVDVELEPEASSLAEFPCVISPVDGRCDAATVFCSVSLPEAEGIIVGEMPSETLAAIVVVVDAFDGVGGMPVLCAVVRPLSARITSNKTPNPIENLDIVNSVELQNCMG